MPVRKKVKENKKIIKEEKKEAPKEKYFYAVGKRKTSVAQVKLYSKVQSKEDDLVINKRKLKDYFPVLSFQDLVLAPFKISGTQGKFRMSALVRGGGFRGQSEAIRLGISRALVVYDENLKKVLRDNGFLTRDARIVERKKPGLKKARRAPQWQKR
ncbi:MAG: 30S ribosomal protein S9 [Candidatus Moranbacteria bacterium]|nr:30S ribosomal protein S9 [Candidatus Moranbacteria bacterium]